MVLDSLGQPGAAKVLGNAVKYVLFAVVLNALLDAAAARALSPVHVENSRFVDARGRERLFRGVNVVCLGVAFEELHATRLF